jgi:alpha-L-rhamnosidase
MSSRYVFYSIRFFGLISLFLLVCASSDSYGQLDPKSHPEYPYSRAENGSIAAQSLDQTEVDEQWKVYLPIIQSPDQFLEDAAIWADPQPGAAPAVALFRHTFNLNQPLSQPALTILADTRYEVYLDGAWIGRGPALFSHTLREYDVYLLPDLSAGSHLLSVLVQWAPNSRRSESSVPFLKAHLKGQLRAGVYQSIRTGPEWKALLATAWNQNAVGVHSWGLIGPTELVDLRSLPGNWFLPAFDDRTWGPASVVDIHTPVVTIAQVPRLDLVEGYPYVQPEYLEPVIRPEGESAEISFKERSIPYLSYTPVSVQPLEAGLLSPGRSFVEVYSQEQNYYNVNFETDRVDNITLEVLTSNVNLTDTVQLDEETLSWQEVGPERPDVAVASLGLLPGQHQLTIKNLPATGVTISLGSSNTRLPALPFQQGVHAGRRLLLAEPITDPATQVESVDSGIKISYSTLPGYAVLDLGRVVYGRLVTNVTGPAGAVLDIGWDERLWNDTNRPLPYPGSLHPEWNQVDSWILDGTRRSISTIDARAGRYILIAAWGQGPVTLENLRVYEESYPVEQVGSFDSPNERLNRIWQVGVDTARLNMRDAYVDPWRERGQWWGDAYVTEHINRVAFGDYHLVRRGLYLMADQYRNGYAPALAPNNGRQNVMDYTMLWVHSLAEYAELTGDTQPLSDTFSVLCQFMDQLAGYEDPNSGLLNLPKAHWSQTVYIDILGFHHRYGLSTAANALYIETLRRASTIATMLGEASTAISWQNKADRAAASLNLFLFNAQTHQFLTNLYQGVPFPGLPQAQAWPLAYGLAPAEEQDALSASLLQMIPAQPVFSPEEPNQVELYALFWVLEGLGRAGHISEALALIENYYGYMLDRGATTWWESLTADQNPWASLSHSWGGSPTWFLSTYVLGARTTGVNAWQVKPAFGALPTATGVLPLKAGTLEVSWNGQICTNLQLHIEAGKGSHGSAVFPFASFSQELRLNGETIWKEGDEPKDRVTIADGTLSVSLQDGIFELSLLQAPTCAQSPAP